MKERTIWLWLHRAFLTLMWLGVMAVLSQSLYNWLEEYEWRTS